MVDFAATAGIARATIADDEGLLYPGVRQQRTVIVTPDYVLDVFRVQSDKEHTYDWTFHPLDEKGLTSSTLAFEPVAPTTGPAPKKDRGQDAHAAWITNGRRTSTDWTWQAEWADRGIPLRLTMLGEPGTEIRLWDFQRDDQFNPPPLPMLQVRRHARSTDFVALYQSGRIPSAHVDLEMRNQQTGALVATIHIAGHTDSWIVPPLGDEKKTH